MRVIMVLVSILALALSSSPAVATVFDTFDGGKVFCSAKTIAVIGGVEDGDDPDEYYAVVFPRAAFAYATKRGGRWLVIWVHGEEGDIDMLQTNTHDALALYRCLTIDDGEGGE